MELLHQFHVPVAVGEAWAAFQDVSSLAECFPGATVTSVDGDSFTGSAKVKLGPIALVYNGSGSFVEKDETAHRMRMDAKGKDKRGNGTAGAHVTLEMKEAGSGTDIEVLTDLQVTGKPAQFGRGVMQDVSDKLLGQFVACLEERFSEPEPAPEPVAESAASGAPRAASPAAATPTPATPAGGEQGSQTGAQTLPGSPPPAGSTKATGSRPSSRAHADDSIDLGATVLPVLWKSYGKQVLVGLAVLVVLRWLLRRRG